MPNPVLIHTESAKIRHFLAIADFYIRLGCPEIYEVEPQFDAEYIPDAYTRLGPNGEAILIEVQRSHISHKQMQKKIDGFVKTYKLGKHDARTMYLVTDENFRFAVPEGFRVERIALKEQKQGVS
jgi:hypothetical protein